MENEQRFAHTIWRRKWAAPDQAYETSQLSTAIRLVNNVTRKNNGLEMENCGLPPVIKKNQNLPLKTTAWNLLLKNCVGLSVLFSTETEPLQFVKETHCMKHVRTLVSLSRSFAYFTSYFKSKSLSYKEKSLLLLGKNLYFANLMIYWYKQMYIRSIRKKAWLAIIQ